MTRVAVLADIHGNLPALEAVLADVDRQGIDLLLIAGDAINWGPFSRGVVELLWERRATFLRGNNEYYLLEFDTPRAPAEWSNATEFPIMPLLREQMGERWWREVATWPDTISLRLPHLPPILACHGSPRDAWEPLFPTSPDTDIEAALAGRDEPLVIAAHTHLPMDRVVGERRVLNPGSVGLPIDGTTEARWLLLDGRDGVWTPEWRAVAWDRAPLFAEFERQGFVERCGVIGHLIVEEFRTARIQVHAFVRWRKEHFPGEPLSYDLLARFTDEDQWRYTDVAYHPSYIAPPPTRKVRDPRYDAKAAEDDERGQEPQ